MAHPLIEAPPVEERRIPMTYDEWLVWSDDSGGVSEWVDGEAIVFMTAKFNHQDLLLFLAALLRRYVLRREPGVVVVSPFEMRLVPGRSSREPDIVFIARAHLDRFSNDRLEGPADLAVEFVSDDSVTRDRVTKFREYAAAGIPEYWIFDPRPGQRTHDFYRLGPEGGYQAVPLDAAGRVHSAVLPGFWLDPEWLWQQPLPDDVAILETIAPDLRRGSRSRR